MYVQSDAGRVCVVADEMVHVSKGYLHPHSSVSRLVTDYAQSRNNELFADPHRMACDWHVRRGILPAQARHYGNVASGLLRSIWRPTLTK